MELTYDIKGLPKWQPFFVLCRIVAQFVDNMLCYSYVVNPPRIPLLIFPIVI